MLIFAPSWRVALTGLPSLPFQDLANLCRKLHKNNGLNSAFATFSSTMPNFIDPSFADKLLDYLITSSYIGTDETIAEEMGEPVIKITDHLEHIVSTHPTLFKLERYGYGSIQPLISHRDVEAIKYFLSQGGSTALSKMSHISTFAAEFQDETKQTLRKSDKPVKTVFVSHSVKDAVITTAFVDLILHGGLDISPANILCVSTEGSKINSGEEWRTAIKEALNDAKVTFLILTPYYKESEVCLNEMGAAWVKDCSVMPLVVEPIRFKNVGPIPEVNQCEKLLGEAGLDHIKDALQDALGLPANRIDTARWNTKKAQFLRSAREYIAANPFPVPLERETFDDLIKKVEENEVLIGHLTDEITRLEKLNAALIAAKDKDEVKAIVRTSGGSSEFEDFEKLTTGIVRLLSQLSSSIRGVVFKSFTSKDGRFNHSAYSDDLEEAVAENYVTVDEDNGFVEADWHTTRLMRNLYEKLNDLENLIRDEPSDSLQGEYDGEYKAPMKIANKSFWEEVFTTTIVIN